MKGRQLKACLKFLNFTTRLMDWSAVKISWHDISVNENNID